MKPSDRLKEIENDYSPSMDDFEYLINRVKRLTEALEYYADAEEWIDYKARTAQGWQVNSKFDNDNCGERARKALEDE